MHAEVFFVLSPQTKLSLPFSGLEESETLLVVQLPVSVLLVLFTINLIEHSTSNTEEANKFTQHICDRLQTTFEPVLSGHRQGMAKRPIDRGYR